MCLYTKQNKIDIAPTDIIVYKVLQFNDCYKIPYRTPYQYAAVRFINGVARMKSDLILEDTSSDQFEMYNKVNIGLHSYTRSKDAYYEACIHFKGVTCYGIIPKGSRYVQSVGGYTIASDNLIIFKTEENFKKHRRVAK